MWNPFTKKSKPSEIKIKEEIPLYDTKFLEEEQLRLGSWSTVWKTYGDVWKTSWTFSGLARVLVGMADELSDLIERNKK